MTNTTSLRTARLQRKAAIAQKLPADSNHGLLSLGYPKQSVESFGISSVNAAMIFEARRKSDRIAQHISVAGRATIAQMTNANYNSNRVDGAVVGPLLARDIRNQLRLSGHIDQSHPIDLRWDDPQAWAEDLAHHLRWFYLIDPQDYEAAANKASVMRTAGGH